MASPQISIIVVTHNRIERLRWCIRSILASQHPSDNFELIVVDDGSSDETSVYLKRLVEQGYPIRFIRQEWRGIPHARNQGIAFSNGELIMFTDDDCIVADDWIPSVVAAMEDPTVDLVSGRVFAANNNLLARYMDHRRAHDPLLTPEGSLYYMVTTNVGSRRNSIERAGGFDETFIVSEDTELSFRMRQMGMKLSFAPECRVYHWYDSSITGSLRRYYRYGAGNKQLFDRYPEEMPWFVNIGMDLPILLAGKSQPWDPGNRGEVTLIADEPWFCLLNLLLEIAFLSGCSGITAESQIPVYTPDITSSHSHATFVRRPDRTKTDIILEALEVAQIATSSACTPQEQEAWDWFGSHLFRALQSRSSQTWAQDILETLDIDHILSLCSTTPL